MSSRQANWLKTAKGIAYQKDYYEKNKEKMNEQMKENRAKKLIEDPDYYKKNYKKYNLLSYQKKYRSTGIRKWCKKGRCPDCNNKTGSYHNKTCPLAFVRQTKDS